jgi:hypothetical protein
LSKIISDNCLKLQLLRALLTVGSHKKLTEKLKEKSEELDVHREL